MRPSLPMTAGAVKAANRRREGTSDRKFAESEIVELTKKFRLLEADKKSYFEDTQAVARKQRAAIEKMQKENTELKGLLISMRGSITGWGGSGNLRVEAEKENMEFICLGYEKENAILEDKISLVSKRLSQVRSEIGKMGGLGVAEKSSGKQSKIVCQLESRMDRVITRFNEIVAENKMMKSEIDALRKERVVFDNLMKKLENELGTKKKAIAAVIESSNSAYESRDQALSHIQVLKHQADKEHAEFDKEWNELNRLIENDKKMREFIEQREKRVPITNIQPTTQIPSIDTSVKQKAETYEKAFATIQAATGIGAIDHLVGVFSEAEERAYSLYTYSNLLAKDSDKLEVSISSLKRQLAELRAAASGGSSNHIAQMEDNVSIVTKRADEFEVKSNEAERTLTRLSGLVWSLTRQDNQPPPNQVMSVLADVETRITALSMPIIASHQTGARQVSSRKILQIKAPSTVEADEERSPDPLKVFTLEELRQKVLERIGRRRM